MSVQCPIQESIEISTVNTSAYGYTDFILLITQSICIPINIIFAVVLMVSIELLTILDQMSSYLVFGDFLACGLSSSGLKGTVRFCHHFVPVILCTYVVLTVLFNPLRNYTGPNVTKLYMNVPQGIQFENGIRVFHPLTWQKSLVDPLQELIHVNHEFTIIILFGGNCRIYTRSNNKIYK